MNVFELVAKLVLDSSDYDKGLDDSEEKASGFGDKLKGALATGAKVGGAALAAAGTAAAALGKELYEGVGNLAAYGDNIDKMSQKLGMSREAYQEWDAIMQHSGTSIESMSASMKTMSAAAESGSDAFEKLGISQKEVESLSKEDLFSKVITGLQGMEEGTERTYIASQLLGRGATELGALLNTSAEDTEAMRQRVHELGGVMSDEAVQSAAAYQDSLQDMQTAMTGLKNGILADFLPSFTMVMDGLTEIFGGDSGTGVGMIKEGITSIGDTISEALPDIISKGGEIMSGLLSAIVENLPAFLDTGFQLIGQMISGISANLPNIINTIVQMGTKMLSSLIQRLPEFLAMGVKFLGSLLSGIVQAIPTILTSLGQLVSDMVKSFTSFDWLSLGKSIIDGIVAGIRNFGGAIANTLKEMASNAFNGIKKFFGINSPSKLMSDQIGRFIPEGIAVGITANADSVTDAMNDLSNMTVDAYDPRFDTSAPSSGFSDSSIIDAINSLKTTIAQMQIVLDSGALVGGIAGGMDAQLGSFAVYKGRGN